MDIMRFPCYNNMEKEAILWEKYLQIAFKDFEQNLDIGGKPGNDRPQQRTP